MPWSAVTNKRRRPAGSRAASCSAIRSTIAELRPPRIGVGTAHVTDEVERADIDIDQRAMAASATPRRHGRRRRPRRACRPSGRRAAPPGSARVPAKLSKVQIVVAIPAASARSHTVGCGCTTSGTSRSRRSSPGADRPPGQPVDDGVRRPRRTTCSRSARAAPDGRPVPSEDRLATVVAGKPAVSGRDGHRRQERRRVGVRLQLRRSRGRRRRTGRRAACRRDRARCRSPAPRARPAATGRRRRARRRRSDGTRTGAVMRQPHPQPPEALALVLDLDDLEPPICRVDATCVPPSASTSSPTMSTMRHLLERRRAAGRARDAHLLDRERLGARHLAHLDRAVRRDLGVAGRLHRVLEPAGTSGRSKSIRPSSGFMSRTRHRQAVVAVDDAVEQVQRRVGAHQRRTSLVVERAADRGAGGGTGSPRRR